MMMGNHRMLCAFTMQQIGRWVVTHSKADSSLYGHCLAITGCLWLYPACTCIRSILNPHAHGGDWAPSTFVALSSRSSSNSSPLAGSMALLLTGTTGW